MIKPKPVATLGLLFAAGASALIFLGIDALARPDARSTPVAVTAEPHSTDDRDTRVVEQGKRLP